MRTEFSSFCVSGQCKKAFNAFADGITLVITVYAAHLRLSHSFDLHELVATKKSKKKVCWFARLMHFGTVFALTQGFSERLQQRKKFIETHAVVGAVIW